MAETNGSAAQGPRGRQMLWRVLHWAIVANLAAEFAYASWMVLVVLAPPGGPAGPLGRNVLALPFEQMVTRRLYAIEAWIAFGALAIYLALTEIAPRLREARAARARGGGAVPEAQPGGGPDEGPAPTANRGTRGRGP